MTGLYRRLLALLGRSEDDPARLAEGELTEGFGFTWGETEDVIWLTDGEQSYKRVEPAFLETLLELGHGQRALDTLDADALEAVESLREEGYLRPGEIVKRETPDGVTLWPRIAAFVVAFLALTAVVAHLLLGDGGGARSRGTIAAIVATGLFVATAFVHELGHYAASRPYFDPTIRPSLLNGIFPALVTKTNGAWTCPQSVRIWINLAGPLVDTAVTLAIAAVHLLVYPDVAELSLFVYFAFIRLVLSLNPLVRGDGYWMLVDAFGAVNLHTRGLDDLRSRKLSGPALYAISSGLFTVLGVLVMAVLVLRMIG